MNKLFVQLRALVDEIFYEIRSKKAGVAFIAISVIILTIAVTTLKDAKLPEPVEKPDTTQDEHIRLVSALSSVNVEAQSVYVLRPSTNEVLFDKNSDDKRPIASLAKLATVYVASLVLNDTDELSVSSRALEEVGTSGLSIYQKIKFIDLAQFSLVSSSNGGAYAIAENAGKKIDPASSDFVASFLAFAHQNLERLGFNSFELKNANGLDFLQLEPGAFASAREYSMFVAHIMKERPDILELSRESEVNVWLENNLVKGENTNPYLSSYAGHIASKTGYTKLAGGNLVLVMNIGLNDPLIITVLGSSEEGRFTDAYTIYKTIVEKI